MGDIISLKNMPGTKQTISNQKLLVEITKQLQELQADIKEIKSLLQSSPVRCALTEGEMVELPEIHPKEKIPAGWLW